MAKNKKEMTPEERLAAALVPEEEQPYELPEGWKWVRLDGLSDIIMGQSPRGFDTTDDSSYTPLIGGAADMGAKELTPHKYTKVVTKLSRKNDLVLCIRATLGRPVVSDGEYCLGRGVAGIRTIAGAVDWIRYYLIQSESYLYEHATGSTFLQVTGKVLSDMPVPYPTVSEQQRLVARIESLFAKLDAAKAKVQSVFDAHETRKAALLHDAFAGKLTAKWREARGVTGDVYQSVPLADVCKSIFDGDHMPPPKSSRGIPFLVISNVNKGKLDFSETRFVPQDYYDKLTDTRKPESGDVLYTLVGTYGIPVLVDTDQAFCFQRHMALLKPKEDVILQRYLWYALQEKDFYREATRIAKGTAQLTVPIKGLRQLTIPMASLPEQQEIVAILDRLLGREEEVRQSAESVLVAIDSMKQSILARAFHGELGA
ncbi:restriction endonuclease subunit S [Mitsuokella jalaludinii]|uniref:restriction endonuclease subunit S n=1 Tax=Mitsuokella jalaludinii TaxID=187979 RepID=UPI00055B93BA|nr:restriction endonuclease subunit S [Mitsuokella jalaludinii]